VHGGIEPHFIAAIVAKCGWCCAHRAKISGETDNRPDRIQMP
jgi:hypothetical protein